MELAGLLSYLVFFLTLAGIYALLTLGLNVQWGFAGMLNVGVAAFFAVGAYASALLTAAPNPAHFGGFGLPIAVGLSAAALLSAGLGALIGLITVNLRSDYLAIASIGIAEIVRLGLKNEEWLTNGVRGVVAIPRPFGEALPASGLPTLVTVWALIALVYFLFERAFRSPWGRTMRGIRDNEAAAQAMGKNSTAFRLQAFALGCAVMGVAGGLYAHFVGFISPEAFDPVFATFLVWVMLVAGGSGNNKGAILGAVLIWGVWSGSEFLTRLLPAELTTQVGALRVLLIGVLLIVILMIRPQGVLPERPPKPLWRE